jgi:pimeloyl-ACP methyl ester carboxylesterase
MVLRSRELVAAFVWLGLLASAAGATWELETPPAEGEAFRSAAWRLWVPDALGDRPVRAIVIRQHGCGRRGLDHAEDLRWQALAAKHDAALLGSHLQPRGECADWSDPTRGSERALLEALKQLAERSGRPELNSAPWAVWGHSGGAGWAFVLAQRHPERTVALYLRSMGLRGAPEALAAERVARIADVPSVLNCGIRERGDERFGACWEATHGAFRALREQGAPAMLAVDPKSSHDCGSSRDLAIPFFDACLTQRLPSERGGRLRAIDRTVPLLGSIGASGATALEAGGTEALRRDPTRSWLLDETTARAWDAYVTTGSVPDKTPPPEPTEVRLERDGPRVTLSWRAAGDLESQLAAFEVRRDGVLVATIRGPATERDRVGLWQSYNYGDEPTPGTPAALVFEEPHGPQDPQYTVTTVNAAGLSSAAARP